MARIAAKSTPENTTRPSSSRPLKKRLDRPSGAKNKVAAEAARQLPANKAAPGAPKMSTARLEAQIVKLERALVRSRERVEKLEVIVSELNKQIKRAEEAELDRVSFGFDVDSYPKAMWDDTKKPARQKSVATRSRRKTAEPVQQMEPALDEVTGGG